LGEHVPGWHRLEQQAHDWLLPSYHPSLCVLAGGHIMTGVEQHQHLIGCWLHDTMFLLV
jgi:hypothetical protein